MSTLLDLLMRVKDENLSQSELAEVTGFDKEDSKGHIRWLKKNKWTFFLDKDGLPIVGRFYARFKFFGEDFPVNAPAAQDQKKMPKFENAR